VDVASGCAAKCEVQARRRSTPRGAWRWRVAGGAPKTKTQATTAPRTPCGCGCGCGCVRGATAADRSPQSPLISYRLSVTPSSQSGERARSPLSSESTAKAKKSKCVLLPAHTYRAAPRAQASLRWGGTRRLGSPAQRALLFSRALAAPACTALGPRLLA
jgi:hypothetical protein